MAKKKQFNKENVVTSTDVTVVDESAATVPASETKPVLPLQLEDLYKLDDERRERVLAFSERVDISDPNIVLNYGAVTLKKISEGCSTFIKDCKGSEEEALVKQQLNTALGNIMTLKNKKENALSRLWKSATEKYEEARQKYISLNGMIEKLEGILEEQDQIMAENIAAEDSYGLANLQAVKTLEEYIIAGHIALKKAKNETLPALQEKNDSALYSTEVADLKRNIGLFEKKLLNLETARANTIGTVGLVALSKTTSMDNRMILKDNITFNMNALKQFCYVALLQARNQISGSIADNVQGATTNMARDLSKSVCGTALEVAKKSREGFMDPAVIKEVTSNVLSTAKELEQVYSNANSTLAKSLEEVRAIESDLKAMMDGTAGSTGKIPGNTSAKGISVPDFGGLQV